MNRDISKFISDQLSVWSEAAAAFRALKKADVREVQVNGLTVRLQYNPGRIRSSAAKVDSASIKARKCFLCAENRPPQQRALPFEGRKGRKYHILVNPYPIFPSHLTIVRDRHVDQSIWHQYVDMMDLARRYPGLTVFYNGPRCGASAPDHLHFQACPSGLMPLEREADSLMDVIASRYGGRTVPIGEETVTVPDSIASDISYIGSVQEAQVFHYKHFTRGVFILRARTSKSMAKLFYRLLDSAPIPEGDKEPMFNALTWCHASEYRAIVFFRAAHRSRHFYAEGPDHLTMSPGCADMAGLFIVPDAEQFARVDSRLLEEILGDVSVSEATEKEIIWRMTRTQPSLQVGIMSGDEIQFEIISDGAGPQKVSYREGKIDYNGTLYDELFFEAMTMSTMFAEPTFILYGMTIGVGFHWERKLTRKFAGSLKFIVENNKVVAVNIIGVEDYLVSVISSEMSPSASVEFLKAHAVISRSWVMARIAGRRVARTEDRTAYAHLVGTPALVTDLDIRLSGSAKGAQEKVERWFDHEDHRHFDVCADDHCQRYQGLTQAIGENVRKAVDSTWGQVLTYEGTICDARFSKCCGGRSELFSTCWENKDLPYLQSLPDTPSHEEGATAFCETSDREILSQVLNDYDLQTKDFFRWKVSYQAGALSDLVKRRLGELGIAPPDTDASHLELKPVTRGPSGRISCLEIKGARTSLLVGKELVIRRILSDSHLKSSAFEVRRDGDTITLEGRGWGHGVGLCQIGAAVMSTRGYDYKQILEHYYPGALLSRQ
ncbi:MAG: DUF4922 domain-containing protein [Bacteroidales bacterium]|nr:DUF4922 domain-containing protein [Bacteroidales bacterium]